MNSNRNKSKKSKTRIKAIAILLLTLIFPMIFNTYLFPIFSGNTTNPDLEEDELKGIPQTSDTILSWWNESWNYRIRIEIKAQEETITDVPIEKRFNFTSLLHELNDYDRFDWNSTRVIEYVSSTGQWIEIPCTVNYYDPRAGYYNNKTNAAVDIFWTMNGTTNYNDNRTYYIYYDTQTADDAKPARDYGFGGVPGYTSRNTENLIYNNYFRLADFSASPHADEVSHIGNADNPFDNVYGFPIVDEKDGYDGRVGRVRDRSGRQAHAGYDQRWNMDYYFKSGYEDQYFPILKVAIKVDDPYTRSGLYCLTNDGWKIVIFTPAAKTTQGGYQSGVDTVHGAEIICDGKWRIYEYDLRRQTNAYIMTQIEWFQQLGAPNSHYFWFDNMLSYETETESPTISNKSYLIPESYVYSPELKRANIQVNAIDLYGNYIPNVNISLYNLTESQNPLKSEIADSDGSVNFLNLTHGEYNFTVTMTSDIGNHVELINKTIIPILIDHVFMIINLTCIVSTNLFDVDDVDGDPVDSGWIVVGNNSDNLQNCTIDDTGQAKFWWVNSTPYEYNYTVYYQDMNYENNTIILATGDIPTPNTLINVYTNLTTINFTVFQKDAPTLIISGIKLKMTNTNYGNDIIDLTTDENGEVKLRWVNSSGIKSNYSLQVEFFETPREFNMTTIREGTWSEDPVTFKVIGKDAYNIWVNVNPDNYITEIISLNPTDNIAIKWGSELKLRMLFNVSEAINFPLGPTYADSMSYQIKIDDDVIKSGSMSREAGYVGRHQATIDTSDLESSTNYKIEVSALKSGFTLPPDKTILLYIMKNDIELNQSENDDSLQTDYWLESVNMSVKPYGKIDENLILTSTIFKDSDHNFEFSIPDLSTDWNLSYIIFDIYNVEHGPLANIQLNITDLTTDIKKTWDNYSVGNYYFHSPDATNGTWIDLLIPLNKESPTNNNTFSFRIEGSFTSATVDVVAEANFLRDKINVEYSKFNVTDTIGIPSDGNGWAIKNITFEISNCRDSTWHLIDPSTFIDNITTYEGHKYDFTIGDVDGTGYLNISDRIIYPVDDYFLFFIGNNSDITFDLIIKVEYFQCFYQNQYLEIFSLSKSEQGFNNGDTFRVSQNDEGWIDEYAALLIKDINGTEAISPSEVGMNITIVGIGTYYISDTQIPGEGVFLLELIDGFSKNQVYTAYIQTNTTVNFTLSFTISFSRIVLYETTGTVTYLIREAPDVTGTVQYYENLKYYQQTIDTSLINAGEYTIRFTINKDHYNSDIKDLDLKVLERLTLINGRSGFYQQVSSIYVQRAINYAFTYIDRDLNENITILDEQSYIWEYYGEGSAVLSSGSGNLVINAENQYILDFNTKIRPVGRYQLIITLDKQNYETKIGILSLTIEKREIDYDLGSMFDGKQVSVVKGKTITIEIELTDPTRGDKALKGAKVVLKIGDKEFEFDEEDDGVYKLKLDTEDYEAFFTSNTITGTIKISKANYTSEEVDITIVIQMEEIVEGVPTFYLLMVLGAIIAVVGSLATYRVIQLAKIPKFIKKARAMKKAIKGRGEIPDSALTSSKEEMILKQFGDDWKELGLSLGDTLGIKGKKGKTLSNEEGGAK